MSFHRARQAQHSRSQKGNTSSDPEESLGGNVNIMTTLMLEGRFHDIYFSLLLNFSTRGYRFWFLLRLSRKSTLQLKQRLQWKSLIFSACLNSHHVVLSALCSSLSWNYSKLDIVVGYCCCRCSLPVLYLPFIGFFVSFSFGFSRFAKCKRDTCGLFLFSMTKYKLCNFHHVLIHSTMDPFMATHELTHTECLKVNVLISF